MKKINFIHLEVRKSFSMGEEISHSITHGVGVLLGILALILLSIKSAHIQNSMYTLSMILYSCSLILLFFNSMLYHAFKEGTAKNVFERFDHSSIYLLIAGSYTPFCLVAIGGMKGFVLCCFQWALAILGVVFKSIWINRFVKIHVIIYLSMSWIIVFFASTILSAVSSMGFFYLMLGGLFYSSGVLFYVFHWFKFHHFVWHVFVLAGSIFHFVSVYFYI